MITAAQSFKIYELLNKHFKNEQDAKALVTEIESVIDAKYEEKKADFITGADKDKLLTKADALAMFATKEDLVKEISPVKAELLVVKWMLGFVLAGILALLVKTFF
ncbi:MAG: hypothetical protein ACYDCN_03635 [Bacteroidia bacterium]